MQNFYHHMPGLFHYRTSTAVVGGLELISVQQWYKRCRDNWITVPSLLGLSVNRSAIRTLNRSSYNWTFSSFILPYKKV
jgi:hypothetical protein